MRFRLRTLLIVVALGPPAIWLIWLAASYVFTQFDHEIPLVLWLRIAIVVAAAAIYLFVPPPGRGKPTFRMLLIALAVAVAGLAAIGIIEKLIGGFDYRP